MELAKRVRAYGETCPGLEQYAIQRFASAFHTMPKALAENAGVKSNEVVSRLQVGVCNDASIDNDSPLTFPYNFTLTESA